MYTVHDLSKGLFMYKQGIKVEMNVHKGTDLYMNILYMIYLRGCLCSMQEYWYENQTSHIIFHVAAFRLQLLFWCLQTKFSSPIVVKLAGCGTLMSPSDSPCKKVVFTSQGLPILVFVYKFPNHVHKLPVKFQPCAFHKRELN